MSAASAQLQAGRFQAGALSILLRALEGWAQEGAAADKFKWQAGKELERLQAMQQQQQQRVMD